MHENAFYPEKKSACGNREVFKQKHDFKHKHKNEFDRKQKRNACGNKTGLEKQSFQTKT